jgi:hypothetical protein
MLLKRSNLHGSTFPPFVLPVGTITLLIKEFVLDCIKPCDFDRKGVWYLLVSRKPKAAICMLALLMAQNSQLLALACST